MQMSEAKLLAQKPTYLSITKGNDGVWSSAGAHAMRAALKEQSAKGVMDLLKPMDAQGMAHVFREVGFNVDSSLISKGRKAVFDSIKLDLQKALRGPNVVAQRQPEQGPMAEKPRKTAGAVQRSSQSPLQMIQDVLRSPNIEVSTFGDTPMPQRGSLQMVAGQALEKGILGFGFDGMSGKYMVPSPMREIVELHKEAARSVATLSTKAALNSWSQEQKPAPIHDFVPDSIQRLLQGGLSLEAAEVVVGALESGSIANHAQEIGDVAISNLLAERGLDVDAPTIQMQAQELGLSFKSMDTDRGMYFGAVVAQDHRASLIKVNKNEVIELTHQQSSLGKPRVGEQLRIEFKAGALSVTSRNAERTAMER